MARGRVKGSGPRKGVGSLYLDGGKADMTDFGGCPVGTRVLRRVVHRGGVFCLTMGGGRSMVLSFADRPRHSGARQRGAA